jgi:hypothetical protein
MVVSGDCDCGASAQLGTAVNKSTPPVTADNLAKRFLPSVRCVTSFDFFIAMIGDVQFVFCWHGTDISAAAACY